MPDFPPAIHPGLTSAQAASRLAADGPNAIVEAPPVSAWTVFARQFQGLVPWVLAGAIAISLLLGDRIEAGAIAAILLLNALVGLLQEWKAETALAALRSLAAPRARVLRDGHPATIAAREVVRGDLLLLEAGDVVAADARLVEAASLEANEALLTGESMPVPKRAPRDRGTPVDPCTPEKGESGAALFAGTSVTRGQGRARITAVGMATEMGRIAGLLDTAEETGTPLQRRLDQVSQRLVFLCAGIVTLIFILGVARGEGLFDMLLAALSLAVAAIPEGLPTVVTLALAVGVQRMARRHALVRQMAAVETLGAAEVIASDKTGTLTTGVLRVRRIVLPPGGGDGVRRRLRHAAAAASEATLRRSGNAPVVIGDPTEGALLLDAAESGIERDAIEIEEPRLFVLPFDSDRKRMAIARHTTAGETLFVKGAPEMILPRCTRAATEAGDLQLDEAGRRAMLEETHALAAQALRLLAIAERRLGAGDLAPDHDPAAVETDLTFLGLAALADAPRPEARAAVGRCATAGIRVVMITGDHPITAAAIARELGILAPGGDSAAGVVLDGQALDALADEALAAAAERAAVYARVTPAHKLRIVRALKRGGRVVAMTGDGVNDAPAIREASVGIAMGLTGTEVTRQAADIVITDDNFASIVNAVEEGRRIFDNIQRTLLYLLAGNLGEVLVMLVAAIAGWPVPFLPVHLLWVNFVTDGMPALALATEAAHPHALRRPPRPADAGFADAPFLRRLALAGSLIALVSIAGFWIGHRTGGVASARALALAVLVTSHITWAFAARSRSRTHFGLGPFSNLRLLVVLTATLGLQGLVQSWPAAAKLFGTAPLGWGGWGEALALGLIPVSVIEISKMMTRAEAPQDGSTRRTRVPGEATTQ